MAVKLVDSNAALIIKRNKGIMRAHRIVMQKAIATAMTNTRLRAEQYIIENTTGTFNPYRARKKQPSTSGRLTSRTGKLKYMLKYGASASNPLQSWKGFGNILCKEGTVGLDGLIRSTPTGDYNERYVGTYRVNIKGDSRLFNLGYANKFVNNRMPQETRQTLALRFQWEKGIRGQSRPIFSPVAREGEFDLTEQVRQKNAAIWRY